MIARFVLVMEHLDGPRSLVSEAFKAYFFTVVFRKRSTSDFLCEQQPKQIYSTIYAHIYRGLQFYIAMTLVAINQLLVLGGMMQSIFGIIYEYQPVIG